jgi:RNA polymerase sigma-B factor
MRIDVRRLEDADVVLVSGVLDLATAPRLRAVLDGHHAAHPDRHVVLDLDKVNLLDAGTAGMFASYAERAERAGGSLRAIGARGVVLEVLQIVSLDKKLAAYDTPADVLGLERSADFVDRWPAGKDETAHALLRAMAVVDAEAPIRAELRQQVIEDNVAFASRLARRFRDRGEPMDDLSQVALLGLVNAVDGYDAERGSDFIAYATPTIVGEIRRYFRDKGWRVKVPRRLQELRLRVNRAKTELSQTMAATPTPADIAKHLGVETEEVQEAIEAARVYNPISLSTPAGPDGDVTVADHLGGFDADMEAVENRQSLRPLLAKLPEREQKIIAMRFFGNMTQSQIAAELGISQMHVSRLLSQTLAKLREGLLKD